LPRSLPSSRSVSPRRDSERHHAPHAGLFEPTIDYVVVKIPRWNFEKFPQADRTLTTQMKSVGEVMAIGRTFKEAFMKGVRSLELGRTSLLFAPADSDRLAGTTGISEAESDGSLRKRLGVPTDRRMWDIFRALDRGWTVESVHESTKIDPWFLRQFAEIVDMRQAAEAAGVGGMTPEAMRRLKRAGFGDAEIALALKTKEPMVREQLSQALEPIYKRVDTCRGIRVVHAVSLQPYESTCEANPSTRPKVIRAPNRPARASSSTIAAVTRPRRSGGRPRDGDDQLQSRDGLDRLRHRRPPVLPAAHL
jgi:carbamoyl-phosphate synthase large subunit